MKFKTRYKKKFQIRKYYMIIATLITLLLLALFGFKITPNKSLKPQGPVESFVVNTFIESKNFSDLNQASIVNKFIEKNQSQAIDGIQLLKLYHNCLFNCLSKAIIKAQENGEFSEKFSKLQTASIELQNEKNVPLQKAVVQTNSIKNQSNKNCKFLVSVGTSLEVGQNLKIDLAGKKSKNQESEYLKKLVIDLCTKIEGLLGVNKEITSSLMDDNIERCVENLSNFVLNWFNETFQGQFKRYKIASYRFTPNFSPSTVDVGVTGITKTGREYVLIKESLEKMCTIVAPKLGQNSQELATNIDRLICDIHHLNRAVQDIGSQTFQSNFTSAEHVSETNSKNLITEASTQKSKLQTRAFSNLQLYIQNIPQIPVDISFSFDFASRGLFVGAGKSYFTPIIKSNTGLILGVDCGVRFRSQSNSFLNYTYGGFSTRIFGGVGVSAIF